MFSKLPMHDVTKPYTQIKDPFEVQDMPTHFNETKYENFTDMISESSPLRNYSL